MKSLLLSLVFLVGCAAPKATLHNRLVRQCELYTPQVAAFLGTPPASDTLRVGIAHLTGPNMLAVTNERRDAIAVTPRANVLPSDVLAWVVIHELTHVHLTGDWEYLPHWLQEGVCEYTAAYLLPHLVATMAPHRADEYRPGYRYAATHGLDHLWSLAQRARSGGFSQVPEIWLESD